jgi:hypothetical protein
MYGTYLDDHPVSPYDTVMKPYGKSSSGLLPLQVRTAYAQVLERLEDLETGNLFSVFSSCGLLKKEIGARTYVYAQGRTSDGTIRQIYLGPLDARMKGVMERFNRSKTEAAAQREEIDATATMLRGTALPRLDPVEWRVLAALAADGIFRVGGVLVGTVAYRCIAGLLGVKLPSASAVTADLDIAGHTLPIAITTEVVRPETALDRLEMGFSPMAEVDPALHGSRFRSRKGEFKVEFLTPLVGRDTGKKVILRQFGVPAVPLRFLDYLIEDAQPALALGRKAILVRVPSPARFAVHKLVISQERRGVPLKTQKDLEQSHDLQQALAILDPEGLEEAFKAARERGPEWARRVDAGMRAMTRVFGSPG